MSTYRTLIAVTLLLCIGVCVMAASNPPCRTESAGSRMVFGESKRMGNGTIRTFMTVDKNGKPLVMGVMFTETALNGLPDKNAGYQLAFPKAATSTFFDHFQADWNVHGHYPEQIYGLPHFDFHFYTITSAQRELITLEGKDMEVATKTPQPQYVPKGFMTAPGTTEPRMGTHWFDPAGPEFHGKTFTQTFIYGYYNGKIAFIEPMATIDYLKTKPNFTGPVPQPTAYQKSGYFPTRYTISYDRARRSYIVAVRDFVMRKAK